MKVYDYKCDTCGTIHEVYVESRDDVVTCGECGTEMRRLVVAPHLSGGIAKTDVDREIVQTQKANLPGITVKQPIIKDRNTGKTLYGPKI